jgi:DNA-directed RNA polymerase specialized sigma24 family protein
MKWYRRDDMDLMPAIEPVYRSDRLRELVDKLPLEQQHLISRVYFGGATVAEAAAEIEIPEYRAKGQLNRAFATLREAVLQDHQVGSVRPDDGLGDGPLRLPPDVGGEGHHVA